MAINSHKMPNPNEEKNLCLFWKNADFLIEIFMTKSVTLLNEFIIISFHIWAEHSRLILLVLSYRYFNVKIPVT